VFQRTYYALTGRLLRVLFGQFRWALRLSVAVQGPDPDVAAPGRPEIVACRHAGPGDSFLLIHALVNWYAREPRIVLKDTLQWDPAIDVLLNRLPSRFIAPGHDRGRPIEEEISELATGLDDNDAFVIFPEGGNFTPFRRIRAIQRLRSLGLYAMARRAEAMEHVLAPRPGGLLAAMDAAPDAGVVFVAHTGLERMLSVGDVWRELPMDKKIVMRWWSVPRHEVPAGRQERIDWLFDWWARIDRWIDRNEPTDPPENADDGAAADGAAAVDPGIVGGMPDLLDGDAVATALEALDGWSGDPTALTRTVQLPSFPDAVAVVDRVAVAAEEMDHHPDIDIRYRTLTFVCATHSAGGVTELDIELARRIDGIVQNQV
jgi:pterin-4a-carbinolamine dehydratase/1-acyl-sn-glycerol-3-phosphate acyltransferase